MIPVLASALLLKATETNQRPPSDEAKVQSVEYHHLLQQWEHHDSIIWSFSSLCADILHEIHQGACGGHLEQEKSLGTLKEQFYWPGHFNDIHNS